MCSLSCSTALVSGAGAPSGVGVAIASVLVANGANAVITSTTERIHQLAAELKCRGFVADLTNETGAQESVANLGQWETLVNNAGMASMGSPISDDVASDLTKTTTHGWQRGLERNLLTAVHLTKAALPLLRKSSVAMHNQPLYAASKATMIGLTRSIALDEAKYGLTCNAIL